MFSRRKVELLQVFVSGCCVSSLLVIAQKYSLYQGSQTQVKLILLHNQCRLAIMCIVKVEFRLFCQAGCW